MFVFVFLNDCLGDENKHTDEEELGEEGETVDIEGFDTPLDPLAEEYITTILGIPEKTTLPLGDPSHSRYITEMTGKKSKQKHNYKM